MHSPGKKGLAKDLVSSIKTAGLRADEDARCLGSGIRLQCSWQAEKGKMEELAVSRRGKKVIW